MEAAPFKNTRGEKVQARKTRKERQTRAVLGLGIPLFLIAIVIATASFALADEECLGCHGRRTNPSFIDGKLYVESVHGLIRCVSCHTSIVKYPHGKVNSVNCGICHLKGSLGAPMNQALQYQLSVHGKAVAAGVKNAPRCQSCHGSHDIFPSEDHRSMTFRKKIPSLCAGCHPAEYQIYSRSIHGLEFIEKGSIWPAVCDDCHEEHLVPAPKEEKWKLWLISECGSCHRRQLDTYRATYHGKVSELGYGTVAKCSDCHGAHGILPLDNPNSTLAGVNILGTCRKCHPKARGNFTKYYAHPDKHNPKQYPQLYYTNLFMVVLLVGVFCFFIPHTLLWVYRSLKDRIEREGM